MTASRHHLPYFLFNKIIQFSYLPSDWKFCCYQYRNNITATHIPVLKEVQNLCDVVQSKDAMCGGPESVQLQNKILQI